MRQHLSQICSTGSQDLSLQDVAWNRYFIVSRFPGITRELQNTFLASQKSFLEFELQVHIGLAGTCFNVPKLVLKVHLCPWLSHWRNITVRNFNLFTLQWRVGITIEYYSLRWSQWELWLKGEFWILEHWDCPHVYTVIMNWNSPQSLIHISYKKNRKKFLQY
jgi:hypothetical protein